ncbi:MAG TPA: NHL repeat-containing protein [bacterium]|nr:NHL repeat-containing protein [bacterium]
MSYSAANPQGMARTGTTLYIAAGGNVLIYDTGDLSTPVNTWSAYDTIAFSNVVGVAINPTNGNVYVADEGNESVYQFTSAGATVNASSFSFSDVEGIAADLNGNLYVADTYKPAVYEFGPSQGSPLATWTAASGKSIDSPTGVSTDSSNNLYIATASGSQQYIFKFAAGSTTSVLNTWVTGDYYIYQMVVDGSGNVYAAEYGNEMVDAFVPGTSTAISSWDGSQGGGSAFQGPDGIIFLSNGDILVADLEASELQEYRP